jgi:2-haloacid dehalogenase
MKRWKQSGLYVFYKTFLIFKALVFQMPLKEFFDYVMRHIKDFNVKEALIIGDS